MSVRHSSTTSTEVRLKLFRNGYHPLPLNFKNPNIRKGWQNGFNLNEGEIKLWATSWPNATNTGILTRDTPVLDIDILDKEAAEAVEALVAEQTNSDYVLVRIGQPPKRAIPFRTDVPFAKITVPLIAPNGEEHKIEFLGDGQQAVVDGIHPDTHAPYSWHGGSPIEVPRSDLPSIDGPRAHKLVDDIVALLIEQYGYRRKTKDKPKSGNGGYGADWDSFFNNTIDHDQLVASAMALLRSGMSDGAVVNFLRAAVRSLNDVDEDRRQRRLDEIPDIVRSARAKIDAEAAEPLIDLGEWSAGVDPGPIKPRQWLLGNQFCRRFISSLFAAGGVGKSVVRLLQFMSMALGRSLCGQHVFRRSRVLLISLDDNDDELQRRIQAVLLHYRIERSELEGWMWCCAPIGRKIALQDHNKRVVGDLEKSIREAIERRKPDIVADAWGGLSDRTLNAILDAIETGCVDEDGHPTGERYTNAAAATDRAVWSIVQKFAADKSEAQCRTVIQAWVRSGLLFVEPYDSPRQRRERKGLFVDHAKRPGTYTKETASSDDFD
jgi:hypothetical protein